LIRIYEKHNKIKTWNDLPWFRHRTPYNSSNCLDDSYLGNTNPPFLTTIKSTQITSHQLNISTQILSHQPNQPNQINPNIISINIINQFKAQIKSNQIDKMITTNQSTESTKSIMITSIMIINQPLQLKYNIKSERIN